MYLASNGRKPGRAVRAAHKTDRRGAAEVTGAGAGRYFEAARTVFGAGGAELNDAAVVRRVLAGEQELYRVLVERYRQAFGRYAVAVLGDADAAADAMQDAFIRAYENLAGCRDPARFGAWFFRILQNRCRSAHAPRRVTVDVAEADPPARERTDAAVEAGELRERLDAALGKLTPEQREAFVLKNVDGRSYEEMADLLGVGVDALKMRVHRARDVLRRLLRDVR